MATNSKRAAFFNVGDPIVWGKWQNKPGRIVRFLDDGKGNPLIEVEPVPKGLKKNKIMPLFRIRHRLAPKVATRHLHRLAVHDAMTRLAADDMEAILMKLRKGITSPLESVGKLTKVLEYLGGWSVVPFIGLVHVKYGASFHGPLAAVQEVHRVALDHQVSSLPSSPKLDHFYTMDVKDVRSLQGDEHFVDFKLWVGAAGFKITSPNGKVFELLPESNFWTKGRLFIDLRDVPQLGKRSTKHIRMYDCIHWLKEEAGFGQQVLESLQMEAPQKAEPRTRDNTGSCPCCFRNIKLKDATGERLPTMVNHGYQRPGWGQNEGNCYGVGFPPFELSPEGTKHVVGVLQNNLQAVEAALVRFRDPNLNSLSVAEGRTFRTITPESPDWARELKSRIEENTSRAKWLKSDIKDFTRLINEWKQEPLPAPGAPAKRWKVKHREANSRMALNVLGSFIAGRLVTPV